ncbi:hypothetical protein M902_3048 [Bacteriovorax sp. BAL6_X]|uniref:hypothetical protein n=1 Tax=Bacteriovorax sp. BAL6_X TaxID=1201290 RepID=UPI000386CB88|nr:hypothetical protein [Bacteriovorax sp. BAL6_X]EPZ50951.1 hypothetical protein M902_3048 [Bacteriovorax sp. BAL6_X]
MVKISRLLYSAFLVLAVVVSTTASAKRSQRVYTLDLTRPEHKNFLTLQYYHNSIVDFHENIENARKYKNRYTFQFLIDDAYAASNDCFLAGHKSTLANGKCQIPRKISCEKSFFGNRILKVRCNPLLFGPGQDGQGACVNARQKGRNSSNFGTSACKNSASEYTTPQIVKDLLSDEKKMEAFDNLASQVEEFCRHNVADAACIAQKERIAKIKDSVAKAKENQEGLEKGIGLGLSKGVGILSRCEKDYRAEAEDNTLGTFFMSSRNIGDTLVQVSCSSDQIVQSVSSSELDTLSKDFDRIRKHSSIKSLLDDGLKIGSELSMKNYILHKLKSKGVNESSLDHAIDDILKEAQEFGQGPFLGILNSAKEEFKKAIAEGKIKKTNKGELRSKVNDLLDGINKQCENIKKKFPCVTSSQTGNYYMGKLPYCASVRSTQNYKDFIASEQNNYISNMINFSNENPDFRKYYATKEFRSKFHAPSNDFAKDCSEKTSLFGTSKPASAISTSDFEDLDKTVSKNMLEDLADLEDKIPSSSKDIDDLDEDLKDLLKYRPYLIAQAFKNNRVIPGLQDMQASFLCSQMRDIYTNDETWKLANVTMAGAGMALSGVLVATGIGSPVGVALATASSALIVGEAAVGVREINDANKQLDTTDTKHSLGLSSTEENIESVAAAESQKLGGQIAVGLSLVSVATDSIAVAKYGADALNAARAGSNAGTTGEAVVNTVKGTQVATTTTSVSPSPIGILNARTSLNTARPAPVLALPPPKALGLPAPNSTGKAVAVVDNQSQVPAMLRRIENQSGSKLTNVRFLSDKVIPEVRSYISGFEEAANPNVVFYTRLGKRMETLKEGKLLEDGSGLIINKGSDNYQAIIDSGLGTVTDKGVVLKFGVDIDNIKILTDAKTAQGQVMRAERHFVFKETQLPKMNGVVNGLDDVKDRVYDFSGLSDLQKATAYHNIESKVARGERLSDMDLLALAYRKDVAKGGEQRAQGILDLITTRDPSLVDKLISGSSATSTARREVLRQAVNSGKPSTPQIASTASNALNTRAASVTHVTPQSAISSEKVIALPAPTQANVPAPVKENILKATGQRIVDSARQLAHTIARTDDKVELIKAANKKASDAKTASDTKTAVNDGITIEGEYTDITNQVNAPKLNGPSLTSNNTGTTTPAILRNPGIVQGAVHTTNASAAITQVVNTVVDEINANEDVIIHDPNVVEPIPPVDPEPNNTDIIADEVDADLLIDFNGSKPAITVTFTNEKIKACKIKKTYFEEDEDGNRKEKVSTLNSSLESAKEYELSSYDYDYIVSVECKVAESDFKLVTSDSFSDSEISISGLSDGKAEYVVTKCDGDNCSSEDSTGPGRGVPRLTPAQLRQMAPPNIQLENIPILNTL